MITLENMTMFTYRITQFLFTAIPPVRCRIRFHLWPYVIFSTPCGLQMLDFEVEEEKKNQSCPKRNEEVRALQCLAQATAHDALSGLSATFPPARPFSLIMQNT